MNYSINTQLRSELIRNLAVASIVGQVVWLLIAVVAGLIEPGYSEVRGWLGPGLIAFTGLAQILDGFPFPADCRWTIDVNCRARELAGELSWQHYAHGLTYFLGAVALMLSVFAMAWRFHGDERWGRFDLFALVGGLLGLLIVGGLFLLGSNEPGGDYGLAQRFALSAAGSWILTLTVGLLIVRDRSASAVAPGNVSTAHPGSPDAGSRAGG